VETDQTQVVAVADVDRTQVAAPVGVEATQVAIRIDCPVCRTTNPPGERWCQDCGFLLSAIPGEAILEESPLDALPRLVASGDGAREFVLKAGANTVGRESADVLLLDGTVSRRHATITLEGGTATVVDHGSTNGTRVAGEPVPPNEARTLYEGDEVRFGSAVFTIALPGGALRPHGEEPSVSSLAGDERPIRARLVAVDGTEYPLREGVNTIGRRSENDVVVRGDPYVSGHHAEIRCENAGCFLVDAGSTNGTFLLSQRLTAGDHHELVSGVEVRLGQSKFVFETVEGSEEAMTSEGAVADPSDAPGPPDASEVEARSEDEL
jgi:pSer/pThr/pTyr-binding forkhead associated (FHA) protein